MDIANLPASTPVVRFCLLKLGNKRIKLEFCHFSVMKVNREDKKLNKSLINRY